MAVEPYAAAYVTVQRPSGGAAISFKPRHTARGAIRNNARRTLRVRAEHQRTLMTRWNDTVDAVKTPIDFHWPSCFVGSRASPNDDQLK